MSGQNITQRSSTLFYECFKSIIERVPQYDVSKINWIQHKLKDNHCIYCCKIIKNNDLKKTGDHFIAVVSKNKQFSNFSDLRLPCCITCNSKKGNMTWQLFIDKNREFVQNQEFLTSLQAFIDDHIVEYYISDLDIIFLKQDINDLLSNLKDKCACIQIVKNPNKIIKKTLLYYILEILKFILCYIFNMKA